MGTSVGSVEVAMTGAMALVFPGGHSTAATPLGIDLNTEVSALTVAEFVPDVCEQLPITEAVATVGVSFGVLQAVRVAVSLRHLAPGWSCTAALHRRCRTRTPRSNGWPFPSRFPLAVQRLTGRAVRALTSTDRGLRLMMSTLSTRPIGPWWDTWTPADRARPG